MRSGLAHPSDWECYLGFLDQMRCQWLSSSFSGETEASNSRKGGKKERGILWIQLKDRVFTSSEFNKRQRQRQRETEREGGRGRQRRGGACVHVHIHV